MRLSGLFVAAVLCLSPVLFAQHSSGGSSSSHSSSFSGSSSSGISHSSYSGGSVSSSSISTPSTKSSSTKGSTSSEGKTSHSLFHRKPVPVQSAEFKTTPVPCLKGSCGFCPRGESRGTSGACVLASNSCPSSQAWNGFACGTQGWFNDCGYLAQQVADQRHLMQGQNDYGQSLRYRMLQDQYQQCLMRSHSGYGAYAFNSMYLLNTP